MKTKKIGVFAVLGSILLVTAMILSACMEPVVDTPSALELPPPPEGMAYLILNMSESNAKTVLPVKPATIVYQVVLYDNTNSASITITTGMNSNGEFPPFNGDTEVYLLPAAEYDVTVNARVGTSTGAIFATDTDTVDLSTGNATANIDLLPVKDTGNGTFAWNFNAFPTNQNNITMTLTSLTGTTPPTIASVGLTGNATVPSGQYRITLTFSNTGGQHFNMVYENVLHIWENLTSTWNRPTAFPDLPRSHHTVTYDLNSGAWDTIPPSNVNVGVTSTQSIAHFGHADEPDQDPIRTPTNAYSFDGWFTAATGGTQWNFDGSAGETILADRTLYAQWDYLLTDYNLTINISMFDDPNDLSTVQSVTGTPVLFSAIRDGLVGIVDITYTNTYSLDSFELRLNGSSLLPAGLTLDTVNSRVRIDYNNTAIKGSVLSSGSASPGTPHELLLIGEDTNGDLYGGLIIITVIDDVNYTYP